MIKLGIFIFFIAAMWFLLDNKTERKGSFWNPK